MQIVELENMPKVADILDTPLSDPTLLYKTCQEMVELCEAENGLGLSAIQVGIPWKLFVVKSTGGCRLIPKGEYGFFVNCDYAPITDEQVISLEGCLSVKSSDKQSRIFEVKRYTNIILRGFVFSHGIKFVPIEENVSFSEQGVVFQHEIDHHRGLLISDIGKEIFLW